MLNSNLGLHLVQYNQDLQVDLELDLYRLVLVYLQPHHHLEALD